MNAPGRRRLIRAAAVALPAAAAVAVLALRSSIPAGIPPVEPLLDELRACYHRLPRGVMPEADETRQAMTACAIPIVGQAVRDHGPETGILIMREMMRQEPRFDDCHVVAHEIAHVVAYTGDEQRLMDVGLLDECSWGYYDGAVMALAEINAEGSDQDLAVMAMRFCDLYPKGDRYRPEVVANCYHGMGHVYWDRRFPDIQSAFAGCGMISAPPEGPDLPPGSAQCAGGVAMSFAEAMQRRIPVEPVLEHPSMICALTEDDMHRQCLQYTAYDDIVHRGEDPVGFLRWCTGDSGLAAGARDECTLHVATYIGRSGRLSLVDVCYEHGGERAADCLATVLDNHTALKGEEAGRSFCAARPDVCADASRLSWSGFR